jgi:hypothetical protein
MSPHSDTLSRFRANQSLHFLLNAACLAGKQQIPIYKLWFEPIGARTHNLQHTTNAVGQVSDVRMTKVPPQERPTLL